MAGEDKPPCTLEVRCAAWGQLGNTDPRSSLAFPPQSELQVGSLGARSGMLGTSFLLLLAGPQVASRDGTLKLPSQLPDVGEKEGN